MTKDVWKVHTYAYTYWRRLGRVIAAPPRIGNSARASSVCASAEVSGCWAGMRSEVVFGGCFSPSEDHSGTSGQGNLKKKHFFAKKTLDLEVILRSFWVPGCNENCIEISMCFWKVLWATLHPFGKPTGDPKGGKGSHFRALWGDKWKCENYAPVEAESLLLRLEGVLRNLIDTTSGPLVLSMRFGRDFFSEIIRFSLPSGSIWVAFRNPSGLLLSCFFMVWF